MTRVILICDRCAKEARKLYDVPYLVVNQTSNKIEEGFVQGCELCEKCARELVETVNHFHDTKKAENPVCFL